MSTGYCLGIDLGTSYSSAAVGVNGRVAPVSFGEEGTSIPSVLALGEDGTWLFGRGANRWAITHPELVVRDFKRRFGDPTPFRPTAIEGRVTGITADEAMIAMYEEVIRRVVSQRGAEPEAIGVAHPANWGKFKTDLLRQSLEASTHSPTLLIPEPQAAARAERAARIHPVGTTTLVMYDLGGGTFDVAVLRSSADGLEPLGRPRGIERLGGIDFDAALWAWALEQLEFDPIELASNSDPELLIPLSQLRIDLLEAKHLLSFEAMAVVPVHLSSGVRRLEFDRKEFGRRIGPMVERSVDHLIETIERDGRQLDEVDKVILMGGSSSIPTIGETIRERTDLDVVRLDDPQTAVARGAALHLIDWLDQADDRHLMEATHPGRPDNRIEPASSPEKDSQPSKRRPLWVVAAIIIAALGIGSIALVRSSDQDTNIDASGSVADPIGGSVSNDVSSNDVTQNDGPTEPSTDLEGLQITMAAPGSTTPYGSAGQDMVFPSSGPITPVVLVWEYPEPVSSWSEVVSDGGHVFATVPGTQDRLLALDLATGREVWSASSQLFTSPIVLSPTLATANVGESLVAFDREDGTSVDLPDLGPTSDTRPFIDDGKVLDGVLYISRDLYVDEADDASSVDVTAISLADGEVIWNYVSGPPGRNVAGEIVISDNAVILNLNDSVIGLDRLTGDELWSTAVPAGVLHLATRSGTVVITTRPEGTTVNTIMVLDAKDGLLRFTEESRMSLIAILRDTMVLEAIGQDSESIVALRGVSLDDGSEHWRMELDGNETTPTAIIIGPDLAYLILGDGKLIAFTTGPQPIIAFRSHLDSTSASSNHYSVSNGYLIEYVRASGELKVYQ